MIPSANDPGLPSPPRTSYQLWGALLILALAAAGLAFRGYLAEKAATERHVREYLANVAAIRVQQLASWQSQRQRRARTIMANRMIQSGLLKYATTRDPSARVAAQTWMNALRQEVNAVNVLFTDTRGELLLAAGSPVGHSGHIQLIARQVVASGDIQFRDFHDDQDGGSNHLALNFPLRLAPSTPIFGALLIAFEPRTELFPLLGVSPNFHGSVESLLLRRDGDSAIFLAPFDGPRPGPTPLVHVPLADRTNLAVRAVTGELGSLEATDHSGVRVFAEVRAVPDTSWFLIVKLDAADVYAPLRQRSLVLGMLVACLVLAAGAGAAFFWRRQQLRFYRSQYDAISERRALISHFAFLTRFANDIILLVGPDGHVIQANDRALAAYGCTLDELQRLTISDLASPAEGDRTHELFADVAREGSKVFETMHRSRQGRVFPVEVSVRVIEVDGQHFRQSIIRDISERKAVDAELRRTLATLRSVIHASPAAIVTVTPELQVTSWNPAAEQIFGWKAAEAVGLQLPSIAEDCRATLLRELDPVWQSRPVTALSAVGLRRDGVRIPLSLSAAPIQDASGAVSGAVAILMDLTRHQRAEAALAESESRFRATFEQAAVGMTHESLDGRFLRVNQRYCELTGYSEAELLELGAQDLTHPADLAEHIRRRRDLLDGRAPGFSVQHRYLCRDGSVAWLQSTVSVARSRTGEPLYFIAVAEDITDRLRAQDALRRSEERFRRVVETAPAGIVVQSGGHFRYLNPAALETIGATSPDEIVGRPLLDFVASAERPAAQELLNRLNSGVAVTAGEQSGVRLDGQAVSVEVIAVPIEYDEQPAAVIFFHDLTERKRAEAERARLEEQLRHSQKMEGVGRLAGGVAHDFNNHLTVISGYCSMLLETLEPDSPAREAVAEIRAAGERAADLTRQLLTFSRKQLVCLRPLSLNQVIEQAGRMLHRLIGEDIAVRTSLAPGLYPVMADSGQIDQVLMNLAINARDAMPNGGVLTIETSNVEIDEASTPGADGLKPGRYATLTVTDTGIGMTPEVIEKIFEPFFTTKARNAGTGLGLSTVYGIVQQSGGTIAVSSRPDHGSSFRIYLPMTLQTPAQPASEPAAAPLPAGGSETILVVEDQAELRRVTLSILRKCGYRLLQAANATEAISLVEEHHGAIDLLLTDVIMPGMTGNELAARLVATWPQIKVLYVSGYTAEELGRHGVLDPGVAYLPKPFTPASLCAKVREVIAAAPPAGRILVIDDEAAVRNWFEQVLRAAGYQVRSAADGKQGMQLLRQGGCDLVVTDIVMPEQEGLETLSYLRQHHPDVRVVVVSGAFEGEYLTSARLLGAHATIPKPVDRDRLLAELRHLLAQPALS